MNYSQELQHKNEKKKSPRIISSPSLRMHSHLQVK